MIIFYQNLIFNAKKGGINNAARENVKREGSYKVSTIES
jgi:hypothetical protein